MLRERGGSAKQPSAVTFVRDITLGWGGALNKILHFDISLFRCLVSSCFTPSSFCRKVFPWMSSASGVSQCCFLSNGTLTFWFLRNIFFLSQHLFQETKNHMGRSIKLTFNIMATRLCAISMEQYSKSFRNVQHLLWADPEHNRFRLRNFPKVWQKVIDFNHVLVFCSWAEVPVRH